MLEHRGNLPVSKVIVSHASRFEINFKRRLCSRCWVEAYFIHFILSLVNASLRCLHLEAP